MISINKISKNFASPNFTLMKALEALKNCGTKCLVVINKKRKLLGTLTDGDIRKLLISKKSLSQKIKKYYNKKPRYVFENQFNFNDLRKEILKNKYELIPVVDKNMKVINIITWDQVFSKKFLGNQKISKSRVIIMAGGEGIRMKPFTTILPKPLIPVQGKSILEHILENFSQAGLKNFNICLGYKNNTIKAFFKAMRLKHNIKFTIEKKPLGTIGPISQLKIKSKEDPIFISNCDIIIRSDLDQILSSHKNKKNDLTIVTAIKNFKIPYGVCHTNNQGIFKKIEEKPNYNALVNTGLYVINPKVVKLIPKNKKFDITDLINTAKEKKYKIGIFPIPDESWVDIGQWNEYRSAAKKLEEVY